MVRDEKVLQLHDELVACDLIDMLPVDKTVRSFNKAFAENLAVSLREEGLYNPIVLRPSPVDPGRYILVQGRHRFYSWWKILKEPMIRATVLPAMDEKEAGYRAAAENVWRFDGNKAQRLRALKVWHDYYALTHDMTDTVEKPIAPGATTDKRKLRKGKNFTDRVQEATGASLRSAQRDVQMAKSFSLDELDIFAERGVTAQQIELVALIAERDKRQELVALIASGMEFEAAWLQIFNTQVDLSGDNKDERAVKAEAKVETDGELNDDDWLTTYCEEALAVLGHPEKFKADATLYRNTIELRARFRSKMKLHLNEAREAGATGPLWGSISRLINISHPKDWHFCPECGGAGEVTNPRTGEMVECKCHKAGYILKTEKYE